jgi:hypothetical protein
MVFSLWMIERMIECLEASGRFVLDAMESLCDAESAMKNG